MPYSSQGMRGPVCVVGRYPTYDTHPSFCSSQALPRSTSTTSYLLATGHTLTTPHSIGQSLLYLQGLDKCVSRVSLTRMC